MLEGLEATVKMLSQVKDNNPTFRLDSEYYDSYYLRLLDSLNQQKTDKLSDITEWITQGPNPIFTEGASIPCLTGRNINKGRVNYENADYISDKEYEGLKRFQLKKGDTLITLKGKGAIGKIGFVTTDIKAIFSRNIGIVRPSKKINPAYLNAYILSKYGHGLVLRGETGGTGQSTLTCSYLKGLDIPRLYNEDEIGGMVLQSEAVLNTAQSLYSSAENYLLECLGMQDFAANPDAYNVKTLKESFLESGRIDAEFYLPKYEDYVNVVSEYAGGSAPLGKVCTIKDSNYTPEHGVKYRYIELANIGKSGDITGCSYENGEDLPTRARRVIAQGDVIVSSIEGSLDSCALVTDDYDQSLCSTGFYVVRSSLINAETLLTLFKSLPIQQLLKKGCSGTILTCISKQEFENIPIPLIRPEMQEEIAKHVRRSFALRKEASELLEKAKLSVEHAIEIGGGKRLIHSDLQIESVRCERLAMWLLLNELGVVGETQNQQKAVVTEKRLSQSFLSSGRLDAEYYQPKYDYLDTQLSSIPTKRLGEVVDMCKSIEPGSEAYRGEGVPFVRVADLSKFGLDSPSVYLDRKAFSTAPRPKKNTILLSKDGSVGIAYKMDEDAEVITSGAILHLSVKDKNVLHDYLTLLLNSPIVRMQAERDAGGSIIQHWKPSEIAQVVIPILPAHIQQKLSEQVSRSFILRRESRALLDKAKLMVEQTIESQ